MIPRTPNYKLLVAGLLVIGIAIGVILAKGLS